MAISGFSPGGVGFGNRAAGLLLVVMMKVMVMGYRKRKNGYGVCVR